MLAGYPVAQVRAMGCSAFHDELAALLLRASLDQRLRVEGLSRGWMAECLLPHMTLDSVVQISAGKAPNS